MRWSEIVETQSNTEKQANESERIRRANRDLDDARRKRTDALKKQQDTTRAANEKERRAKVNLSKVPATSR